jgi:glycosyltransferase involved in cell wall biosynthesis
MNSQPLVSVIIPTYGRTDYVVDALNSVVEQTYRNIEIIVVDDNAKKPSVRAEIERIVKKYPACKLIQNKFNLGGSLTRNEGIKASQGELISFLDDDDTYEPTRIEEVVALYSKNKTERIGLIYTYTYSCDAQLNIRGEYRNRPSNNPLYKHMCGCLCATSQWTIPKIVFDRVGMFEDSPCKQDSIMLLKILGAGYIALCVEKCLSRYREHGNGIRISGNFSRMIEGESNLLSWQRKYYHALSKKEIQHVEFCTQRRIMYALAGARDICKAFDLYRTIQKMNPSKKDVIKDFIIILIGPVMVRRWRNVRKFLSTKC